MDRLWVIEARITGGPPGVSLSTLMRGGMDEHASDHDCVSLSTLMRSGMDAHASDHDGVSLSTMMRGGIGQHAN